MKFLLNKNNNSPIEIIFFDKNRKLLCSKMQTKEFLEETLTHQTTEKTKIFHTFYKEKKYLLAATEKIETTPDFLKLGGKIGKKILSKDAKDVSIIIPNKAKNFSLINLQALLEGILLGCYRYKKFLSKEGDSPPRQIYLTNSLSNFKESEFEKIMEKATIIASSCNFARDCANDPGNFFDPESFLKEAQKIARESKIKTTFLDKKKLKKEKMNCILAVSQGSSKDPYLIMMEYKTSQKNKDTVLLVGKGITFDCGGISIKPSLNMEEMKFDMCGGAAVLGAMKAIGKIQPNVNVTALIPASENLVNGSALKPGDIITAYNGKTIEVANTDAEGRLILADALAYGSKNFKPNAIIDLATLTGACVIALGKHNCGLMSDNNFLAEQLENYGKITDDKVWRLPLDEEYQEQINGTYSDLKNIGGRDGGTITAGIFLKNFTNKIAWAHLDIAGTAWSGTKDYHTKGATGFGVRLLVYLLENWKSL